MGGSFYNTSLRSARAASEGYSSKAFHETFKQVKESKIHESMDPKKIRLRESRDSVIHPLTFPIIFGMDVTGSMGDVPHMLIKDGLPKMISDIIQRGVSSPALMFLGLGDSEAGDRAPLQVAQFESGDAELDMWLTRTWPEGKGGGNAGESYLWAWYFAANHTVTDAWEKRKEKGLLITFGDEPCLPIITKEEMKEVMDIDIQASLKAEDLLKAALEKWHVYHIHLEHNGRPLGSWWQKPLGHNLIVLKDYHHIPETVAKLAANHCSYCGKNTPTETKEPDNTSGSGSIIDMPITL